MSPFRPSVSNRDHGFGDADSFAMNIELVQKVIAPVTGYLDGMMEIGKGVFRAEQQSAPDDGLHPNNPEAELITSYSFLCICFGHPSIIDSCLNIANLFDMPAHGLKWSPIRTKTYAKKVKRTDLLGPNKGSPIEIALLVRSISF